MKKRLRKYAFWLPGIDCKTNSSENSCKAPRGFQDGWSELRLVSQIVFKLLVNLGRGTYNEKLLTQAISLKLVFVHI